MAETTYRLTLAPVAAGARLRFYDPLADRDVPCEVRERAADSLTVELPVTDTPRLLTVEEAVP